MTTKSFINHRVLWLLVPLLTLFNLSAWGAVTFTAGTDVNGTKTITKNSVTLTLSSACPNLNAYDEYRIYSGASFTVTCSSGMTEIVVTTNTAKGNATKLSASGYSASGTTGTWTGDATSVTISADQGSQVRILSIAVTTKSSYSVTWTINPAGYGTLSTTSGTSTTVTPGANYTYGSPAYTVTSGTATVSQTSNTFTATPSANCTIRINMVEKPKYTVTLMDDGDTRTQASYGASVTLPSRAGCSGFTFAGWTKSWVTAQTSWTTTAPTIIPAGSYTPTSNENLYPVYTKTESGGGSTTKTYGWENTEPDASSWTIDTYPEKNDGQHHTGSYAGRINTNNTYVTFNEKVKVTEFSFYFTRTSNNNNYNVYIETSTDGSSWSAAETFAMSSFDTYVNWKKCSKTWDGETAYYVRFHCYNTTAVRWVDDISITYSGGSTTSYISVPNCCTPLGTINGSVSLSQLASPDPTKLKATWTMNASTGISSYNLEVYNSSDVLVKTINGYTSGSEITGLTPCTTYYVKLYTVSSGGDYCPGGLISTSSTVTTNGYTLTVSKSNVSLSSGSEPSTICSDVSATYSASVGYVLPSTITVTNAGAQNTGWTWNSSTGVLTINKASVTGNVTVTITGVEQGCSGQYTFAYGATPNADGKNIDGATKECFSQVGETTEYQITGFTIPTTTQYYWVGYNGSFYNDGLGSNNASSSRNQFKYMPVANLQGSSCGGTGEYYKHAAAGAYGTLRIYSNYSDNNLYVGFSPAGYQMRVGSGESWSNIQLTRVSSTSVWKSDVMDMSAALIAKNYYINVWTSGSYSSGDAGVAINNWTDGSSTISSMQRKTNSGESYASGVTATMRGFFRTWTDNCANNGYAHFVPVHRVIYDANWPVSGEPAATYSTDVSVEESGNITVPAAPSAPTGYHFVEWNTADDGNGTGYDPGDTYTISAGASADPTLYAIWSNTTAITLSKNGGSENGSAVGTYGSNVVGSFVPVTRNSETYRLLGYSKSGTPAEIVIDASGNFVANTTYTDASGNWNSTLAEVTLVAQWQAGYTIKWMANGEVTPFATTFVDAGNTLVLPGSTPTSCDAGDTDTYLTFIGWYSTAAGTNSSPTANIASCGTKATAGSAVSSGATYYAVWGNGGLSADDVKQVTLDFTSNTNWSFPTDYTTSSASYTSGDYTVTMVYGSAGDGWKYMTDKILYGKTGTYMQLPAFSFTTSKIIATGPASGASGSVTWNVFVGDDAVSTEVTGSNGAKTFNISSGNQTAGTVYKLKATNGNNIQIKTIDVYSPGVAATGFISTCCGSPAVVSVTPTSSSLELDIDGEATTSVSVSQSGGGAGRYYPPTVTPAGASVDFTSSYKTSAYSTTFTATAAGTYTVKAPFRETSYDCDKFGSATITVAANPILTPSSNSVAIDATCGLASSATDITVNSRYLASTSITASVATSTGTGSFKISSDNSSFDTSNKTITGGTSSKATSHIYVRYDATEGQTGSATGTLTLTCGAKVVNITLSATVTCSAHVVLSSAAPIQITAANGIWVEAANVVNVEGSYLTTNSGPNSNVSIRAYTDNAHFQIKTGGTTGEGAAKTSQGSALALVTNHSTATWSGSIGIVYKPAAHNTTETATLTVEVYKAGGSTIYDTKTYTLYGRSLPENFVIAVTDGSGNWFAVPADMIAPWGGSCSSGLSTYKPYPIEVDNTTTPTAISGNTPSRAVYTAAARTGNVNTNAQTLSFKSVTLAGSGNYYLYGSVSAEGSATNIQNASNASSEKQKWFLDVIDWSTKKYNMHLSSDLNTNLLSYYSGNVGQYAASGKKPDIYILPATSTCDNYNAPENISCQGIDATNYTIRFKPDRTKNYEVSLNGSSWSDVTTSIINECTDDEHPTLVEAQIPLATYRGETVYIRVKAAGSCAESTTFDVPNPTLTVNAGTWLTMTGMAGEAFNNSDNSITISDLATCASEVSVSSSNPNIGASVNSSTGVVTLTMTAGNATEGVHNTTLTFTAGGATTRTQNVTITMVTLAPQSFSTNSDYFTGNILCADKTPSPAISASTTYILTLTNPVYTSSGVYATTGDFNGTATYVYDVAKGTVINGSAIYRSITSGIVSFSLALQVGDMVDGREYRIEWINTDGVMKDNTGLAYQDASYTFIYSSDCSKPIATVACPVGKNSFTANWIPSGASNQTFNAYWYSPGTSICDETFTKAGGAPHSYSLASSTYGNDDSSYPVFLGILKGESYSSMPAISWQDDSYGGYRLCNSSKRYVVFSAKCSTAGTYTVTFKGRCVNYNNTIQIFKATDDGATSGDALGTYTLTTTAVSTITLQVALSSGQRIVVVPEFSATGTKGIAALVSLKVEMRGAKNYVGSTPASGISSSVTSRTVTSLTAGKTYYYTVSNGSESNEMEVTTRSDDPAIDFTPGKAVIQTESGGTASTTINLDGTNLTLCELAASITGTNAALFDYDLSDATYNVLTGELSGSLTITYHPTSVGTHTATLTIDGVTLDLEGHSCPAGFETMATDATSVTENSATANWSQSTTGFLMLAENQKMDTELLINGGFELDGMGWDGIPNAYLPTNGSRSSELNAAMKKSGSNGLYVRSAGNGSYLYPYNVTSGSGILGGAIYGAKQTLPAGTYTISAYVHGASNATTLSSFPNSDQNFYIGFAVDCPSSTYPSARRSVSAVTGTNVRNQSGWVEVSGTFTLNEPTVGYIFLCNSTSGSNHAVDDVSLKCTGVVAGNTFEEHPITSATSLALTDLKPSTSYSYYVVSSSGCESNIISFTTDDSDDPVSITADPNPVNVTASKGTMSSQLVTISQENAYSSIMLSVGDACDGRISVSPTSVGSSGGAVVVGFTPKNTDNMGDHGTCTITATTLGLDDPYEITVNWTVASGVDVNTPTIEVVNISNSSMDIEHNITKIGENSEVIIDLSREKDPATVEANVGDELFFSKYYEAYSHKKILAIYNPTDHDISLANTYIWRSKGKSAGDDASWNQETGISLASYGKTTGTIASQEEIILYNSQLTYSCEQTKTDMSEWFGTSEQAILYDGDDAFLLARKDVDGDSDDPPTESVEEDGEGNPLPLSWRQYTDANEVNWWMLDLIGARTKANTPDGSAVQHWSWKNCSTGVSESGDEYGWVGYGMDVAENAWTGNTCVGQTTAGYLLSTNRCLLIRNKNVKSGNNAVAVNVGDMYTLGKGGIQSEWKGAHVPTTPSDKQDSISCANFSFVGGYDYAGYYNAWTDMSSPGDFIVGSRNPDGSYTVSDMNMPQYWCNTLRIKVVETETVNGVEVANTRHYQDYKVPIVVDENATTATAKFFGNPNNPSYSGAEDNFKKGSWTTECPTCDVVIRDNATLTHNSTTGKTAFRNVQVYAGSKLSVTSGNTLDLNGVMMHADNNTVSYAILNDDGSTITIDTVLHVKRVDDAQWYPFSLPYDCDVVAIRQLNGKSMGVYDDGVTYGSWTIKEYDGEERQSANDFAGVGNASSHWHPVAANGTLQANKGYVIGLYETEWAGQHKQVYFPPKTPIGTYGYTESSGDTKTAVVKSWAANNAGVDPMNKGWNFVGLPYISLYNNTSGHGINNTSVMIEGSYEDEYADQDHVYVAVPSDNTMKRFSQSQAGSTKLEPFKGYFVQVDGTTNADHNITYYKSDRTLTAMPRRRAKADASVNQRIGFELLIGPEETQDRTGILLSDDYSLDYEIGRDMYKMTISGDKKPHIWSINPSNVKMAYSAMPMANGENIPLGIYLPAAGAYTLTKDEYSDVSNVEAIYLLRDGEIVADLLFNNYDIEVSGAATLSNYAIRVVARKDTPTGIDIVPGDGADWNSSTPRKFIYQDKLYILRGGNIYDATGKRVSIINR